MMVLGFRCRCCWTVMVPDDICRAILEGICAMVVVSDHIADEIKFVCRKGC